MSTYKCDPELTPQMAGMGDPPDTISWSDWHWWSVVSGLARTKLSISSLKKREEEKSQTENWYFVETKDTGLERLIIMENC